MAIKFKKLIGLIGLIGLISPIGFSAFAQAAPEFLISWRAINYVPADYQGKILPSKGSAISAGFDLIDQNKIVNLSKYNISWYLNGNFLQSGIGLKKINFTMASALDQTMRITVFNYKNNDLDQIFLIPGAKPEIIISTKTPNDRTARNQMRISPQNYTFEARPFFFNVSNLNDLRFQWKVNDKIVEGTPANPEFLGLNLTSEGTPRETELKLTLNASNIANPLELAGKLINFVVK